MNHGTTRSLPASRCAPLLALCLLGLADASRAATPFEYFDAVVTRGRAARVPG